MVINWYGYHGLNQGKLFKTFADWGYSVYTFDRRGIGCSEGTSGDIKTSDLLDDNWAFCDMVMKYRNMPEKMPKFILGYTLGAL
jgi:predicted alpha/beta hydrolase